MSIFMNYLTSDNFFAKFKDEFDIPKNIKAKY